MHVNMELLCMPMLRSNSHSVQIATEAIDNYKER